MILISLDLMISVSREISKNPSLTQLYDFLTDTECLSVSLTWTLPGILCLAYGLTARDLHESRELDCPSVLWMPRKVSRYIACVHDQLLSRVWLLVTPWNEDHPAHLSLKFSRQEYWGGLSIPPLGGSFWPRNRTHVSFVFCIGRQILYHCTTWEPQ